MLGNVFVGVLGLSLWACFGLAVPESSTSSQDQVQKDSVPFMRAKLDHSKEIVEGLSIENFDMIAKNAQDLMLLSLESNWNVFQSPEYVEMSRDFRNSAERLREAAKQKNLDGATLAYLEVTLNCVRCHRSVRQKIQAQAESSDDKQPNR